MARLIFRYIPCFPGKDPLEFFKQLVELCKMRKICRILHTSQKVFFYEVFMRDGIGVFIWKLSVALYLIANGALGVMRIRNGDFDIIFRRLGFSGDVLNIFVLIAGVIAIVAGIAVLLEIFDISLPFLGTLTFVVAIIWAVYIVVNIISWFTGGMGDFWLFLQRLAVHSMVLGSLLVASRRFG